MQQAHTWGNFVGRKTHTADPVNNRYIDGTNNLYFGGGGINTITLWIWHPVSVWWIQPNDCTIVHITIYKTTKIILYKMLLRVKGLDIWWYYGFETNGANVEYKIQNNPRVYLQDTFNYFSQCASRQ